MLLAGGVCVSATPAPAAMLGAAAQMMCARCAYAGASWAHIVQHLQFSLYLEAFSGVYTRSTIVFAPVVALTYTSVLLVASAHVFFTG